MPVQWFAIGALARKGESLGSCLLLETHRVMDLSEVARKPKGYYEKLLHRSDQPENDAGNVNDVSEQV